ncbi:MAG: hypothetical protein IIY55_03070, partial [Blautia sp.]|nr:hypothetical protein [Blautia sp.]
MKKGTIWNGILATVGILALSFISYAAFQDSLTVTNHLRTGDVNIRLTEHMVRDGKEQDYTDPETLLPGTRLSKIVRVENLAASCYVRMKVEFESDRKEIENLKDADLLGLSGDWKKAGEYYYYTKPLGVSKNVDFISGLQIPSEWTEEHAGQKIRLLFHADAIQSENMKPDFTAMSPWGNQKILACVHEDGNSNSYRTEENARLQVEFSGKAHKLIAVPEDFFQKLKTLMPGDIVKDQV